MNKLLFFLLNMMVMAGAIAQPGNSARGNRLLDQPMPLKAATIHVDADFFTATTVLDLSFSNPNDVEMEGVYRFRLEPGQVITDFKLELNGKLRDGSIEEKWKANNAYNSIVGKRVDPAIVQMESQNSYRLNIYPFAPKGTRRVVITIQQMMVDGDNEKIYNLPLQFHNKVDDLTLNIKTTGYKTPNVYKGLLEDDAFGRSQNNNFLLRNSRHVFLNKPIHFGLPLPAITISCAQKKNSETIFAVLPGKNVAAQTIVKPKTAVVYWDASSSLSGRDIEKEKQFMQQYILHHTIKELTIIPFNHEILDTAVFNTTSNSNDWKKYLDDIEYDGATQLGLIDAGKMKADMVLIFTDGYNTFGRSKPKTGNALVNCISTTRNVNTSFLENIVQNGGGSIINLNNADVRSAVAKTSYAKTWLMNVTSSSAGAEVNAAFPVEVNKAGLISGKIPNNRDTLVLVYGFGKTITYTEKILIDASRTCASSALGRIQMFTDIKKKENSGDWNNMLEFGLKERIVTMNTAYLVLEMVADYVTYNIQPPAELMDEAIKLGYVKRDTRNERLMLIKQSEEQILANVVNNRKQQSDTRKYYKNQENLVYEKRMEDDLAVRRPVTTTSREESAPQVEPAADMSLQSVVVTGVRRDNAKRVAAETRDIVAAEEIIGRAPEALQRRVTGIVTDAPDATPVSIRGASSVQSKYEIMYVYDGRVVDNNVIMKADPNNIARVDVLKGPGATALYGSKAANGVILINSKNYRGAAYNNAIKLKNLEDVEYVMELKSAAKGDKLKAYEILKIANMGNVSFHLDVADIFYESGMAKEAKKALLNAAEAGYGNINHRLCMAYIFEKNRQLDDAALMYISLLTEDRANLGYHRNLAWVYYQQGKIQQAVDVLTNAIKLDTEGFEAQNMNLKAIMVNDLNAMVGIHKKDLDLTEVPEILLDTVKADLRIILETNLNYSNVVNIKEPGNKNAQSNNYYNNNSNGDFTGYNSYSSGLTEYVNRNAAEGKYHVTVYANNYGTAQPNLVKQMVFKNFGKPGQTITTSVYSLENQNGYVEISDFKFSK